MDTSLITDAWSQITSAPMWLLLVLVFNIVGFMLKQWPQFPNKLIPVTVVLLGAIFYPLLADHSAIPATQKYPVLVMVLLGLTLGFVAWMAHGLIWKRIGKYFSVDDPEAPQPPTPPTV